MAYGKGFRARHGGGGFTPDFQERSRAGFRRRGYGWDGGSSTAGLSGLAGALDRIGRHLLIRREANLFVGVLNGFLLTFYVAIAVMLIWAAIGGLS